MFDSQTFSIICSILLALLGLVAYRLFSHKHPLPPGPPGKLISGNLHQLPKNESWRTYAKWAETYGQSPHFNRAYVFNANSTVVG
jgi:hypothetical protein